MVRRFETENSRNQIAGGLPKNIMFVFRFLLIPFQLPLGSARSSTAQMQKFGEGVKERVIVKVPQEVLARLHKIGAAVDTSAAELRQTAAKSPLCCADLRFSKYN